MTPSSTAGRRGRARAVKARRPRRRVGERVATIPRQSRHAHPELPERLGRPQLVAELLHALERQQQPDPLPGGDRLDVPGGSNLGRAVRVLAHGAQQAGRLAEGLAQGAFGLSLELDEDRADLEADTAGFEQRRPARTTRPRRTAARGGRARATGRGERQRSRARVYEGGPVVTNDPGAMPCRRRSRPALEPPVVDIGRARG